MFATIPSGLFCVFSPPAFVQGVRLPTISNSAAWQMPLEGPTKGRTYFDCPEIDKK
jgi:hypothetical protein